MGSEPGLLTKMDWWIEKLTPDHHSQAGLFCLLWLGAALFRSWPMLLASLGFIGFALCFGHPGTFQRPLRLAENSSNRWVGILIVIWGLGSLVSYVLVAVWNFWQLVASKL
ncbi:MAG TPA: hypothetical protein PLL06_09675 [Acidobacteriota bacterium]|nr:hypothetical protein [Acidobacteriota bacterium]HNC43166.1 hypothetical protein [Acidobacteriota bacterium]HND19483.1 hypothetical protein [Acidobacteriota bacterium]HNJ39991.1 hypothetical protein [Acidobacteriota bacterium]